MAGGRALALRGLKTVAAWGDRVRSPGPGVVVLIYHRVGGGSGTEIDLDPGLFDEQMAWLAESGRALSLDDALGLLVGPAVTAPPGERERSGAFGRPGASGEFGRSGASGGSERSGEFGGSGASGGSERSGEFGGSGASGERSMGDPVVVTFDDGTADLAEVALPILARHRVPATVYVATDFVARQREFPADGTPLTWAATREMVASGLVTIGSHTHTHALVDRLPPGEVAAELDRSIELIGEHAGVTADHFAYPKAVAPPAPVEAVVRDRFRSAALGGCRPNPYGRTDPHRLSRSAVQVSDGMDWFVRKAEGGLALEDAARRTLNRFRYAGASN